MFDFAGFFYFPNLVFMLTGILFQWVKKKKQKIEYNKM